MSNRFEVPAKVEAAINQCSFISSADVTGFQQTEDGMDITLSISSAVDKGDDDEATTTTDPSNSSAVDRGQEDQDEADSDSSNSSAVDEESEQKYPDLIEVSENVFRCPLCEDYEGSKGQVNGHKGHCDSPSNSSAVEEESENDENDTSPSNSSAVEEGKCGAKCQDGSPCQMEVPCHHHSNAVEDDDASSSNSSAVDKEEVAHPDNTDNATKENYLAHFGECQKEGCSYGASGADRDFCASHPNSSAVEGSNEESGSSSNSSAVDKSYRDLTEAQKGRVEYLIEDEGKELDEAMSMV